ncbi:GNAT family N-acetyltransferase [Streptomyces sp. NPDC057675]|uniref:GNAT family N-acetyltransferase n=1 Tax=Streptomyces sp. NPDC057675 TaxID=3346204 RepID=UPI0036C8A7EC
MGAKVMVARDLQGQSVGLLCLLDRHPADGFPWIGLLMVHGRQHRHGIGRQLADIVKERFRERGHDGIRLAVLENTPTSLAFWSSLGWQEIDRRADNQAAETTPPASSPSPWQRSAGSWNISCPQPEPGAILEITQ